MSSFIKPVLIECLASLTDLPTFSQHCEAAMAEMGIECQVARVELSVDNHFNVEPHTLSEALRHPCPPRIALLRLVAGCFDADEYLLRTPVLIGADARYHSSWQRCAFFGVPSGAEVRQAILRLSLDPMHTGYLCECAESRFTIPLSYVHAQAFRQRMSFLSALQGATMHGRILWVDANPHVDTILDPYGLSLLNEIARRNGFLGEIISPFSDFENVELSTQEIIKRFQPNLVGISVRNFDDVLTVRSAVGPSKKLDTSDYLKRVRSLRDAIRAVFFGPTLAGGAALTRAPLAILDALDVDYGVQGPAEYVVDELLKNWRPNHKDLEKTHGNFQQIWNRIPGVLDRRKGESNNALRLLSTTSTLIVDAPHRAPEKLWHEQRLAIPTAVRGTYGCPLNCNYCLEATPGRGGKRRDAAAIVNEMEWLMREYGISHFHLTDSEANLPFSKMRALAGEIIKRNLGDRVSWTAYVTPAPFDVEAISMLLEGGLRGLKLSVDHFVPSILLNLGRSHKDIDVHKILSALSSMTNAFSVSASILLGAPGENWKTIECALSNMQAYSRCGIVFYYNVGIRLYPGTPLFSEWRAGRLSPEHCYGSGIFNDGMSPLVYCAPVSPRIVLKTIVKAIAGFSKIRGIEPGRPIECDDPLRLLQVALARWHCADAASAIGLLASLGVPNVTAQNFMEAALRFEETLRRENKARQAVSGEHRPVRGRLDRDARVRVSSAQA